jgi:hypothetical protein
VTDLHSGLSGARRTRVVATLAAAFVVTTVAPPARADVSSWFFLGAGPTWLRHSGDTEQDWTLRLDTGLGTSPLHPVVVGGLGRVDAHVGHGVDLGLMARIATRSFVLGGWGAAIDLGGYQRWWTPRSTGGQASLVLGGPWGLTLGVNGGMGTREWSHWGATLGIDFARLTVYRTSGEAWFPNPFPPGPKSDER